MEKKDNKNYPGRLQAVGLVGLVLLIMLIYSLFMQIFMAGFGLKFDLSNPVIYILSNIVASFVSIGGAIYYVIKYRDLNWNYIIGACIKQKLFYFKVILLILGLTLFLSEVDNWIQRFLPRSNNYLEIYNGVMEQNVVLVFIALCISAPFLEETLFRGIILRGLLKKLDNWSAIFFSAFLFAILHMNIWQGISAFLLGLFIGWLFDKTRSLPVTIFAHFFSNLIGVLAVRLVDIPGFTSYSATGSQPLWLTFIGLILTIIAILLIEKGRIPE